MRLTLALLLVAATAQAEPSWDAAGLSAGEQDTLRTVIADWQPKAGPEATACLASEERGACADTPSSPQARGLLHSLAGIDATAEGRFGEAAQHLRSAIGELAGWLPTGHPLWGLLHSSRGVALHAAGDLAGAVEAHRTAIVAGSANAEDLAAYHLNLAWAFANQGQQAEAATACEGALIDLEAPWLRSPPGVLCLNYVGSMRFGVGDVATAEALWTRSLGYTEAIAPPEDPSRLMLIGNLGNAALQTGRYDLAVERFQQAVALAESQRGPGDSTYWYFLAEAYAGRGDLDQAEAWHQRLLDLRVAQNPRSAETAMSLTWVAALQQKRGHYDAAERSFLRALAVGEGIDPEGLQAADAVAKLGEFYREVGRLAEAGALHERAVGIWRATLGVEDPTYAAGLVNQANLLRELGDHARTKVLYEEALASYERIYGPEHPHTATARTNLAGFLQNLGDFDAALPMLEQALASYEAALGAEHEWVATGLNNLALLHWAKGDPATAWPLLQRATAIWETTLGASHPNTLTGRQNLAQILSDVGEHQLAYDVQSHDLEVARARLGPDHPLVGESTIHLASNLAAAGNAEEALQAYGEALRIVERSGGAEHPRAADVRALLAQLHWDLGAVGPAREQIGRAFGIVETRVQPLLTVTSERERIALIRAARSKLDLLITTHDRPADAARVHAAVLRWKGAVKASLVAERSARDTAGDPALEARVQELSAVRSALATALFAPPGEAAQAGGLAELSDRKEALERELAQASAGFAAQQARQAPDPRELCRELAPDEALVDFLRFGRRPGKDDPGLVVVPHYTALVLLGGACRTPIRVELGEAEPTDKLIARYRRRIASGGGLEQLMQRSEAIRAAVWDPVAAVIAERGRIWLVPDGGLTGLPFGALVRDGRFLVEDLELGYLASATDLLPADRAPGEGSIVAGGITYDAASEPVQVATSRGAPWGALDAFGFLPATVPEAKAVAKTLARLGPVSLLSGAEASEGAIRAAAPGSRFVHLATHGFFATGDVRSALSGEDAGAERAVGFNPMLLSGVVLAGANQRGGGGEDGVLTAEEVVSLDLRSVELVTLSACETGLGEVTDGEGVLGLRRAFALAGARALALSLWKVPDAETGQLMAAFYAALVDGAAPVPALRTAQLAQIEALRSAGRAPHPLFWAAFLVSGR